MEWNEIKQEGLPPILEPVLVAVANKEKSATKAIHDGKKWIGIAFKPTHWADLPEAPKKILQPS